MQRAMCSYETINAVHKHFFNKDALFCYDDNLNFYAKIGNTLTQVLTHDHIDCAYYQRGCFVNGSVFNLIGTNNLTDKEEVAQYVKIHNFVKKHIDNLMNVTWVYAMYEKYLGCMYPSSLGIQTNKDSIFPRENMGSVYIYPKIRRVLYNDDIFSRPWYLVKVTAKNFSQIPDEYLSRLVYTEDKTECAIENKFDYFRIVSIGKHISMFIVDKNTNSVDGHIRTMSNRLIDFKIYPEAAHKYDAAQVFSILMNSDAFITDKNDFVPDLYTVKLHNDVTVTTDYEALGFVKTYDIIAFMFHTDDEIRDKVYEDLKKFDSRNPIC